MPANAPSQRPAPVVALAACLLLLWVLVAAAGADAAPQHRTARASVGKASGRAHAPAPLRAGRVRRRAPLTGSPTAASPGTTGGSSLPAPFGLVSEQVAPGLTPTTPEPVPTPSSVGVRVSETPTYRATLSRPSVLAGSVRIQLQNEGEDDHDLRITRTDDGAVTGYLDVTSPGRTRSTTLTLSPGTYRLACTLQAPVVHADAGMRTTLTVTS